MLPLIVLSALAIALVGLASALEVTLFNLPQTRIRELRREEVRWARFLAALRSNPAGFLIAVWTLRSVGIVAGALSIWHAVDGEDGTWVLAALAVAGVLVAAVLSELAGKSLGQRGGERLALTLSLPAWLLARLLTPIAIPTEILARRLNPEFGEIMPGISDREIRDLAGPSNGGTVIEEHERRLIERAFLLDQTTAYDVMTPRVDILAWSESRTLAQIAPELRTARYSRIPLYHGSIDQITGVLYTRDAYQALISGQRDVQLRDLAREPFFVPGSITLDRLLLDFQTRRIHMGIVIDEYGGVDGLIALEDILEELVGEIIDESDIAQESIIRLGRGEILVDGSADLREINHFFNTTFPLLEHRSLNGYLLDVLGRVPEPGERIIADAEGVVIEVTAATDTQVLRARLSRRPRGQVGEEASRTEGSESIESEPVGGSGLSDGPGEPAGESVPEPRRSEG